MKSLTISILTAGASMILLAGCADLNPALVQANAVCRDGWYGYWQQSCEPAAAPYGVAEAERDIADLKEQVQSLTDQLTSANELIARLSENQAALQDHVNLAKAEKDLFKALQPEIARGTVAIKQSGDGLTINLDSSLLFAPGHEQLQDDGKDALIRVGTVLKDFPGKRVHVAGHTDSTPIRGALQKRFPSNKELSDARAQYASEALQEGGLTSDISAEGHGADSPIATNTTVEGRAKNRRVEVLVSL